MSMVENILIIDDHPMFSDGVSLLLKQLFKQCKISSAKSAKAGLELISQNEFDWIFLDYRLPDLNGVSVLKEIQSQEVLAPVVVISAEEDEGILNEIMENNACGFLAKSSELSDFKECIHQINLGNIFLKKELKDRLSNYRNNVLVERARILNIVSSRQLEVLKLVAKGFTNAEIAKFLSIKESTIKSHVHALMQSFETDNRTLCVLEAQRLQIV